MRRMNSLPQTKRVRAVFSENLRKLMEAEGIKAQALAKRAHIAFRSIYAYRNDEKEAGLEAVEALAGALGVEAWQMLYPGELPQGNVSRLVKVYMDGSPEFRQYLDKIVDLERDKPH